MKKTITDLGDLQGKRVFLRLDFNVPLDENGNITDDNERQDYLLYWRRRIDNHHPSLGRLPRRYVIRHLNHERFCSFNQQSL